MTKHFDVNLTQLRIDISRTMERMEAIQFDWYQEHAGGQRLAAVKFIFVLKGEDGLLREYQYSCERYDLYIDNLRAIQLTLDRLWRISEEWMIESTHGAKGLLALLQGFRVPTSQSKLLALPDPTTITPPHEILGVPADATIEEIKEKYRELSQLHHPDHGGDNKLMTQINQARDDMLEVRNNG